MHRRTWDAQSQAVSVSQGLTGQAEAALGPAPQSSPRQSDPGRDPVWAHAASAFAAPQVPRKAAPREQEHARLHKRGGALTLERNNSDARLGSRGNGRGRWCSGLQCQR
jgi:hypothetical protein